MLTIVDAQNRKLEPQRCNQGCWFQTIVWPWLVTRSGFGICLKHCKLPSWKFQLSNWISGTMLLEFAIDQIRTHGSQLNQRDDHAIKPPSKITRQNNEIGSRSNQLIHFISFEMDHVGSSLQSWKLTTRPSPWHVQTLAKKCLKIGPKILPKLSRKQNKLSNC